jgi:hypothetical protein
LAGSIVCESENEEREDDVLNVPVPVERNQPPVVVGESEVGGGLAYLNHVVGSLNCVRLTLILAFSLGGRRELTSSPREGED